LWTLLLTSSFSMFLLPELDEATLYYYVELFNFPASSQEHNQISFIVKLNLSWYKLVCWDLLTLKLRRNLLIWKELIERESRNFYDDAFQVTFNMYARYLFLSCVTARLTREQKKGLIKYKRMAENLIRMETWISILFLSFPKWNIFKAMFGLELAFLIGNLLHVTWFTNFQY